MINSKTKLAGAMVAMFLFGGVAGAGLSTFCHPFFSHPPGPEEIQQHMFNFLDSRLRLTPEQREQIKPITVDFANQTEAAHKQSLVEISQIAAASDERIKQYLNPDQKTEMDKLTREWQDNFVKHGAPPYGIPPGAPPPHDHPPGSPPPPPEH